MNPFSDWFSQWIPLHHFFTDPVYQSSTIGSMILCFTMSLIGVTTFYRKESLIGETLSHASYPGLVLAAILLAGLHIKETDFIAFNGLIILSAFIFAILGLLCVKGMQTFFTTSADAALCTVLSCFFGIGIVLASYVQFIEPSSYRLILSYFYGQAATMTHFHVLIYLLLSCFTVLFISVFYKEIEAFLFDPLFAKSTRLPTKAIQITLFFLTAFSIVLSIRSVGVILVSALMIAPVIASKFISTRLSQVFLFSGLFGALSGFLGNYLAANFSSSIESGTRMVFPTGPMIVLSAALLAFLSLLFSPREGLFIKYFRALKFRQKTLQENILKSLWRFEERKETEKPLPKLKLYYSASVTSLYFSLWQLKKNGWIEKNSYRLTPDGQEKAKHIVRFHRLWELYLTTHLGFEVDRVHKNAEEIEHILTPDIEKKLIQRLKNPIVDPHNQPIP